MTDKNTGGPAFPAPEAGMEHFSAPSAYMGMTLRDYFAAHAPDVPNWFDRNYVEKVAQIGIDKDGVVNGLCMIPETDCERLIRWRWNYADDMLKARGL